MSNLSPYPRRRSNGFRFRIAVPADLGNLLGVHEISNSLRTADHRVAFSRAPEHAAWAKRVFADVRFNALTMDAEQPKESLRIARMSIGLAEKEGAHAAEVARLRARHADELERTTVQASR